MHILNAVVALTSAFFGTSCLVIGGGAVRGGAPSATLAVNTEVSPAASSAPDSPAPVTNLIPNALARRGDTIFVGGPFTYVGPVTGPGLTVDLATWAPTETLKPRVFGKVAASIPDSARAGGVYIGGDFSSVGGVSRSSVARLLPDRSVDATFVPPTELNSVNALALSPAGDMLFVGGTFFIGGRFSMITLNTATGAQLDWGPPIANAGVTHLSVIGDYLYVGSSTLRAIQISTATAATEWNPGLGGGPYYSIVDAGAQLIIVGYFNTGGFKHIAKVQKAGGGNTGTPDAAWKPNPTGTTGLIMTIFSARVDGDHLYVAGRFTAISGVARAGLARLSVATGATDLTWTPGTCTESNLLAVTSSRVYLTAGQHSCGAGSTAPGNLHSLSTTDATSDPATPQTDGAIATLTIQGTKAYVGGTFLSYGGVLRDGIAAFDATTGEVKSWKPTLNGEVRKLVADGDSLYVAGDFSTADGSSRSGFAAYDVSSIGTTPVLRSWNPAPDGSILSLAVKDGTVYAGGSFQNIGSPTQARARIAALGPSGEALSWNPGSNGNVELLAVRGNRVYAAGSFTTIGGKSKSSLAAIATDADTNNADDAWTTTVTSSTHVKTLAVHENALFLGGQFTTINGNSQPRLAAVSLQTGALLPWNPGVSDQVNTLHVNGSTLFAGGFFFLAESQPRKLVAAYDISVLTSPVLLPLSLDMDFLPEDDGSYVPEVTNLLTHGSSLIAAGLLIPNSMPYAYTGHLGLIDSTGLWAGSKFTHSP